MTLKVPQRALSYLPLRYLPFEAEICYRGARGGIWFPSYTPLDGYDDELDTSGEWTRTPFSTWFGRLTRKQRFS